jgi:osmotically-inducible protein OsmY
MPLRDSELKQDIMDRLEMDERIDLSRITVDVLDRKAVLTGSVRMPELKEEIIGEVGNIPGVLSVDDRLTVQDPETAAQVNPKREDITKSILKDPELHVDYLSVDIMAERIILGGYVKTPWEKERAEMLALQLPGISEVENRIIVTTVEKEEDYAIAQQIGEFLKRKSEIPLGKITITVNEGEIVLAGIVPTWYDKNTIYDAAVHTAGVKSVENDIQVEQY